MLGVVIKGEWMKRLKNEIHPKNDGEITPEQKSGNNRNLKIARENRKQNIVKLVRLIFFGEVGIS